MKGRTDERDIILKFTLIKALKELVESDDVSEKVAKTYMKVLDKKTKDPDEILQLLKSTNDNLKNGAARDRFKVIDPTINDLKMNEHIKDILGILNDKDKGVDRAINTAISIERTISKARMEDKRLAEEVAENMARLAARKPHK